MVFEMCKNTETPIEVFDKTTGQILKLKPKKVWILKGPRNEKGIKIALFKSPLSNKYFRARLPDNYPC